MNIKAFSHWKLKRLDYYRTVHSLKTAIACLIGLGIEKYYNWPSGVWVPITIMVVMSAQPHFGGVLSKAYMRFLGTVCGVIVTILTLLLFGTNLYVIFVVTFIVCVLFSYLASSKEDISYAGTLGGVTVLLTLTSQGTNVIYAAQRGLYIVIGIIIALLMSRLIFPIHARDRFRYHVGLTLRNLKTLYFKTVQMQRSADAAVADVAIEAQLVQDIATQPRLIQEAVIGSKVFAAKKSLYQEVINIERRIHRLINLMYRSIYEVRSIHVTDQQLSIVNNLHISIENTLEDMANCFTYGSRLQDSNSIDQPIAKIISIADHLPTQDGADKLLVEHSFLFCMEQIIIEINRLQKIIHELNLDNN